jgi:predicted component of type VI protein secretion system
MLSKTPTSGQSYITERGNCARMATNARASDAESEMTGEGNETPVDDRIRELVDTRATEVERRIEELEAELEELENFAKITLRDRRISENSDNIGKLSDSFSGFAESTSDKLNTLENRIEVNSLVLAAVVEALEESGDVDLDFSDVEGYQADRLVTDVSANDRLADAIEESS